MYFWCRFSLTCYFWTDTLWWHLRDNSVITIRGESELFLSFESLRSLNMRTFTLLRCSPAHLGKLLSKLNCGVRCAAPVGRHRWGNTLSHSVVNTPMFSSRIFSTFFFWPIKLIFYERSFSKTSWVRFDSPFISAVLHFPKRSRALKIVFMICIQ